MRYDARIVVSMPLSKPNGQSVNQSARYIYVGIELLRHLKTSHGGLGVGVSKITQLFLAHLRAHSPRFLLLEELFCPSDFFSPPLPDQTWPAAYCREEREESWIGANTSQDRDKYITNVALD